MPRVGNKHFPYTPAGYAAAAKAKAGSKTAPAAKASATAQARSHGQQGAAMKAMHAGPKATTPVIRPKGSPRRRRAG